MPRKIRQLIKELKKAGFDLAHVVGDHRKFEKNGKSVMISGGTGDDAKPYQEKQVWLVILETSEPETTINPANEE
jgi:predicted RNA binding protein YcfA (HicA-like mRNA interferase family)